MFKGTAEPIVFNCHVVVLLFVFGVLFVENWCCEFCVWLFGDLRSCMCVDVCVCVCVRMQATALPGHVLPRREVRGLGGARNGE